MLISGERSGEGIRMSCFILGDSIAKGVSAILHGCASWAKVGATAATILAHTLNGDSDFTIISAGSNPPGGGPALVEKLTEMRRRLQPGKIIWIVPINKARGAVSRFAAANGDDAVTFRPGRDMVHPKSYRALSNAILAKMK